MIGWQQYALGALLVVGAFYSGQWIGIEKGRVKCLEGDIEAVGDVIAAKASDDSIQADARKESREDLQSENADLRAILDSVKARNAEDVETGRACLTVRDGSDMLSDYNKIFGDGVRSGRELDG